jgi:hypothetical protein
MSANLLELQEMLRNLDMNSVRKVASGEHGKAAQLLGMDEIRHRGEQMQAAKAEEAEQQAQQPAMIDQYLAMSQQIMGQPPSMPSAMPPAMPAPPQQGIGSMMPPQAPPQMAAAPPAPTPQPPVQMMAGGGSVGGSDLMNRPKMGNMGIVEYLVSTGMSREEAMALADSIVGGDQSNALKAGGFIQKYAPGGSVEDEEEAGLISDAIDWAKENPAKAAEYGLDGLLTIAAFTPVGGAARLGSWAIRAARTLGPRAMKTIRAMAPRARATKRIDERIDLPDTQLTPRQLRERADLIAREASGLRRQNIAQAGLGAMGVASLMGDEEPAPAAPQEFGAITYGDLPGEAFPPPSVIEDKYQLGDTVGGENDNNVDTGNDETALGFLDRVKGGEFNPFFQFLTRAGLELAAGKGENLGQDIAQAGIAGMGEVERLADRDMAIADREREQARQEAADALAERQLEMDEELLPFRQDLLAAQAEVAGRTLRYSDARALAKDAIESGRFGTGLGSLEDLTFLTQLIFDNQNADIGMQKFMESKGLPSSLELPGNKNKLLEFMGS